MIKKKSLWENPRLFFYGKRGIARSETRAVFLVILKQMYAGRE